MNLEQALIWAKIHSSARIVYVGRVVFSESDADAFGVLYEFISAQLVVVVDGAMPSDIESPAASNRAANEL